MGPESSADGFAELAGFVSGHLNGSQGFLQEPVLLQVLLQPCKQAGRTSYICLFVGFLFFKALKSKQDGIEAPHLLQWDQRPLGVFIWLCLCN